MDANSVNAYISAHASEFPMESINTIREKLLVMSPEQFAYVTTLSLKNPVVAFILAFFLGGLGIGRFYIGDILLGVLKLITCGGFGIWWLIDLFIIMGATRKKNLMTVMNTPL